MHTISPNSEPNTDDLIAALLDQFAASLRGRAAPHVAECCERLFDAARENEHPDELTQVLTEHAIGRLTRMHDYFSAVVLHGFEKSLVAPLDHSRSTDSTMQEDTSIADDEDAPTITER